MQGSSSVYLINSQTLSEHVLRMNCQTVEFHHQQSQLLQKVLYLRQNKNREQTDPFRIHGGGTGGEHLKARGVSMR